MSVMSAADAGGSPGTGQEILLRGPRTAAAAGPDRVGPEAGAQGQDHAGADPLGPERPERRLRLVSTEVHVREVRVAREVTRTVRAGGARAGVLGAGGPARAAQWARAEQASVQRTRVQRLTAPGVSARRVSTRRASGRRVTVREVGVRPGGLRLTRRGRRVLTGLVMLVIVVSAMLIFTSVAGGAQAPGPAAPAPSIYQGMTQIVVQPGQTLWSIAAGADPAADPRTVVQQISDVNALNGDEVEAGQLLWVPRG